MCVLLYHQGQERFLELAKKHLQDSLRLGETVFFRLIYSEYFDSSPFYHTANYYSAETSTGHGFEWRAQWMRHLGLNWSDAAPIFPQGAFGDVTTPIKRGQDRLEKKIYLWSLEGEGLDKRTLEPGVQWVYQDPACELGFLHTVVCALSLSNEWLEIVHVLLNRLDYIQGTVEWQWLVEALAKCDLKMVEWKDRSDWWPEMHFQSASVYQGMFCRIMRIKYPFQVNTRALALALGLS